MKTLLTKKFLSIFFSILSLNAFAVEVIVPSYLQGVVQDSYALKGHNYIYEVEGNLNKQPITPERTDNKTIEDLLKSLMFSYLSKNNPLFLSLHSEKAQQALKQLDQKMVEKNWEFFSKVKKTFYRFLF